MALGAVGPLSPPEPLERQLRDAGLVDEGTGATWVALMRRRLVITRTRREPLGDLREVKITPLGRNVVRAALGEQAPKRPPAGQLRERQWAALARLYASGEDGVSHDEMLYGRSGFDWVRTLLRLRDYKPHPLMEEYQAPGYALGDGGYAPVEARMRLTAFRRECYEREWPRYRDLYPAFNAPEPEDAPPLAPPSDEAMEIANKRLQSPLMDTPNAC